MSPRSISSTVLNPFRTASSAIPVWLIEIPTGLTSPTTLRYCSAEFDITWNSLVWSKYPMVPPTQRFEGPGEAGGLSITIGDADHYLNDLVENGASFEGQTVVVYLTDIAATGGSGSASIPDEYIIESVIRGEGYITFNLRNQFGSFDKKVPGRLMLRSTFRGLAPGPLV